MADERSLNYEVNVGADKAANDIEKLKDDLDEVVDNLDEAESKSKGFTSALDRAGKIGGGAVGGIGKNLDKNFGGAVDRANKRSTVFIKNLVTGAKNIGNAFLHPIQTIRKHLVDAVDEAEDETHGLETKAEETGRSLDKMGNAGKNAGDAIKRSISAGLKVFLGIEAIKKATQLIKEFVTTSLNAAQAAEGAEARFSALFENTDAAAWAENYAEATKTAISNVQTWMSDNKSFLDYLGYSQQEASNLSKIVTGLGDDIAEALHVDESSVMTALQDALSGDFKSLHSIGVKVDEEDLKAMAARFNEQYGKMGFGKDLDKLTEAQYASVALASILESTSSMQGKSIQEASTLAGATENLKDTWQSALERIGEALSPAFIEIINRLSDAIVEHTPAIVKAAESVGNALIAMAPKVEAIASWLSNWISDKVDAASNKNTLDIFLNTGVLPELSKEQGELFDAYVKEWNDKITEYDQGSVAQTQAWVNKYLLGIDYSSKLPALSSDSFPDINPQSPGYNATQTIRENFGVWQRQSDRVDPNFWGWVKNGWDNLFGKDKEEQQNSAISNDISSWYQSATDTSKSLDGVSASADVVNGRMDTLSDKIGTLNEALSSLGQPEYTIPGNARGTSNFSGGWTKIHEEGDELAFLPQGTAIIPADETNQIIEGKRSVNVQFSPQINIQVPANADESTKQDLVRLFREEARKLFVEMQNEEFDRLAVQNAYARG